MNLDDLNNYPSPLKADEVEQPVPEKVERTGSQIANALLSQSIIGHDYYNNSLEKFSYDYEPFEDEDASALLDQYNLTREEKVEMIRDGKSITHIYDMAEDRKRNDGQMEMIQSYGAMGMAGVLGASLLDVPSWAIGLGFGKVAGIGIKAGQLYGTSAKLAKAGAGAGTAIASTYGLEKSIGNEMTPEQLMISSALGFTLGYVASGAVPHNPEMAKKIQQVTDGTIPIVAKHPRASYWLPFMHSPSDRLKASKTPFNVELGDKFSRRMDDTIGLQDGTRVKDVQRETKGYLTEAMDEFEVMEDDFFKQNGRKFDDSDNRRVSEIGLSIDNEFVQVKKKNIRSQKKAHIEQHVKIINKETTEQIGVLQKQADDMIADIKATEEPAKLYRERPVYRADKNGNYYEMKSSVNKASRIPVKNEKALLKHKRNIERRIKKVETALNKEIKTLKKNADNNIKNISKGDFDDVALKQFDENARIAGKKRLDDMMESIDPKYKKAIEIVQRFQKRFGDRIVRADLDGMSDLDTNFHWMRQYDADLIAKNPDGAIEAFERGLRANFDNVNDELGKALREEAENTVNNIMKSVSSYDTIDLDLSMAQRISADSAKKNSVIGKYLKGRKLDIDGSKMTDFMNNDIASNLTGYSRIVGGRLGLKEVLDIDSRYTAEAFANKNKVHGKDRKFFDDAVKQALGTHSIDPLSNSVLSKIARGFADLNYINFGGWFGVNTLSDISGIVNDFQFGRTMKYVTGDIVGELGKSPKGKSLARYLGYASESITNDRAMLYGSEGFIPAGLFSGEKTLQKGGQLVSKLSGMNMVVDFMDRVTSLAGLDYILTAERGTKFVKTMNRLGLSADDVTALRKAKGIVDFDDVGAIKKFDFEKLDDAMRSKLERGLRRVIDDTVLKGNDLDAPAWLTEIFGSHALAKSLFQFMRFPVIAYNKLGRKMAHNFDAIDAVTATATGALILGLTTQMKDIGKENKRYDLSTKEGQLEMTKYVIDRMPHLAIVGLVQTQMDVIGRILHGASGEDYNRRPAEMNMGVTISRLQDIHTSMQRYADGSASAKDIILLKSFASTNLFWLQPFNNMLNDSIKE